MDLVTAQLLRKLMPLFAAVSVCLLILCVSAILYLGREIFVPFALGVLLSFILAPIVIKLQRLNVPRGLAISSAILTATAVILLLTGLITTQLASLVGDLPAYRTTVREKIASFAQDENAPSGPFGRALEALQGIASDIEGIGGEPAGEGDENSGTSRLPMPVTVVAAGGGAIATVSAVVAPLLGPLTTIGIVIVFAIFILLQREDLRNRFIRLVGTDDLQHTTAAIDDAAKRLSRLLLFQFAMNAGFAVITGAGLYLIGVPSPFLWGVLGGVLRYIPYVGGFLGAGLPMAVAFAVDPGWSMIVWVALLYILVETAMSNIAEPILYGHSTGLSPVAIIIAALVWALLWGPVGLILATPLTICLVVMGRYVPQLAAIDIMLGDQPALSPGQLFYQRMLADAPQEAALQAREFLKGRALATYYDEVALEGMQLAHEDVARFAVEGERLEILKAATLELVGRLDRLDSPLPRGGSIRPEAKAAVDASAPDRETARIVKRRSELRPEWQTEHPIVCVSGKEALDAPVTAMLAQVFTKHGLGVRRVGWAELAESPPSAADTQGVALVCLSFLEPLSTVHLRLAVREVHRIVPSARVIVGIWRQRDPEMIATLSAKVRADGVVTSFNEALACALEMSSATKRAGERDDAPPREARAEPRRDAA